MMMEADIGVMGLQTKEYQRPPAKPEAKRQAWNRFSPRAFRKSMALPIP